MDPATISWIAKVWIAVRPIKRLKERRQQRMAEKLELKLPDGSTIERVEPIVNARTSTKLGGVGLLALVLGGLSTIPFYDQANAIIMQACQSESGPVVALVSAGAMLGLNFLTARFTKSPLKPGKL